MDSNKICFITCVNDEAMYKETLLYIKSLNVPTGIKIETIAVRNARSIASGYNEALTKTDAKYKVYLHQDVFIINKNFISDFISIFDSNSDIGMIGMTGSRILPTSGCWWEAKECCGQVYESHRGKMNILKFENADDYIEDVQAIDGFMMITQYDIKWREDIFDGWHFYDASQSVEFLKKKYRIVVPPQKRPWCIHDCGTVRIDDDYKKYQNTFLNEYSKFLFPSESASDIKEIEYILRRIENSISINNNLKLLNEHLDKIDIETLNDIIMKSIVKKEMVFNGIAIELFNNHKYADSLRILELSYKYNHHNKDTVYNLSYIIYQLGDKETALNYLDLFSKTYYDTDILRLKEEILGGTNE